jgi:hypothetical protein
MRMAQRVERCLQFSRGMTRRAIAFMAVWTSIWLGLVGAGCSSAVGPLNVYTSPTQQARCGTPDGAEPNQPQKKGPQDAGSRWKCVQ